MFIRSHASGQALTEFVIIAPVIAILTALIVQFSMIAVDLIKLAAIEREAVVYLSSHKGTDGLKRHVEKIAAGMGVNKGRIEIREENRGNDSMLDKVLKIKFIQGITGLKINIM